MGCFNISFASLISSNALYIANMSTEHTSHFQLLTFQVRQERTRRLDARERL